MLSVVASQGAPTAIAAVASLTTTSTATDTFDRQVSGGFGSATAGGAWAVQGPAADTSVTSGTGRLAVPRPGSANAVYLSQLSTSNADVRVATALAAPARGSGSYVSVIGRRVDDVSGYRVRLRVLSDGSITTALVAIAGRTTTTVASKPLAGVEYTAGQRLLVRMQAEGTSPTTLRAKVWPSGSTEPAAWTLTGSDSTSALQRAGSVAASLYVSSNATGTQTLVLDDLSVRSASADTAVPTVSVTPTPATGTPTASTKLSLAFSASEAATFSCRYDSTPWSACTSPVSYDGVGEGSHTVQVRATDAAGNVGVVQQATWQVDRTGPSVSLTGGPASGSRTTATTASLPFTVSEPGQAQCRLDSGPFVTCTSPYAVKSLKVGAHTVQVRGFDRAGNVSAIVSRTWTVTSATPPADTTAPETTITSGPAQGSTSTSTSASFGFSSSEAGTFQCQLDAGSWTRCTSPAAFSSLSQAAHTVRIRAVDAAGNTDATAATRTWTVVAAPSTPPTVGGKPGSANTGVPTGTKLTVHQGDLTITKDGTVVDAVDVRGFLRIQARNVKVSRSIIRGGPTSRLAALVQSTEPGVVLEDVELAPTNPSVLIDGLKGYGFTAKRVDIHHTVDGALVWGSNTTIQDSWIHDNAHYASDPAQGGGPSHDDGIQVQGGNNLRFTNNVLCCAKNTALMITQDVSKTSNLTWNGNWTDGGACSINIAEKGKGAIQGLTIQNNRFGRHTGVAGCAIVAPLTTKVTDGGNVYDDNGQAVVVRKGS